MRTITLALATCVLLVGCSSPTTTTRMAAKAATMFALDQTDATISDAESVRTIAITVKGVVGEGPLDTGALRTLVLEAIISQFQGSQQLLYATVVDEIISIIESEIELADPPLDLGEAGIYINAAAMGVEQGASLYILFAEN